MAGMVAVAVLGEVVTVMGEVRKERVVVVEMGEDREVVVVSMAHTDLRNPRSRSPKGSCCTQSRGHHRHRPHSTSRHGSNH